MITLSIICLLFFNLFIFDRDLLAPPVVVCAGFAISALCALYNNRYWKCQLSEKTFFVIVSGLALFSAVSFITKGMIEIRSEGRKNLKGKPAAAETESLAVINVSDPKMFFLIFMILIISVWHTAEIAKISSRYGTISSINDISRVYNAVSSYGVLQIEEDVNFICKQLYKLVNASSYVCTYILINNMIVTRKLRGQLKYLIPTAIYIASSVFTGGRYSVIRLVNAAVFIYYMLYVRNTGSTGLSIKFISRCAVAMLGFCTYFVLTSELVGRTHAQDPLYYIAYYTGGSIPLFDEFLKYPPPPSDIFGKETFFSINNFIGKYFKIPKLQYITHHEFRYSPTGYSLGNVYTVFRRSMYDFGHGGMLLLYSVCAIFYSSYYYRIRKKKLKKDIDFSLMIYAFISYGLTMQFYGDAFYSSILSVNTVTTLLMIYCCKLYLFNFKWGTSSNKYKYRYRSKT